MEVRARMSDPGLDITGMKLLIAPQETELAWQIITMASCQIWGILVLSIPNSHGFDRRH